MTATLPRGHTGEGSPSVPACVRREGIRSPWRPVIASRGIKDSSRSQPESDLAAVYREYLAEVYRYVYRRCGDRALSEDVAQDAFLAVIRTADEPSEVSIGWLLRVARNRLIDIVRRSARYDSKLRLLQPRGSGVDEGEVVAETMRVRAALTELKEEHRLMLILHYIDGMTIAELADDLGRSEDATESLIRRARRNMVRQLERADA
jgi:RNA polymerase sigma-70 factor (ECF subfamily)